MKTIIFTLLMLCAVPLFSQDKDTIVVKSWARDTLTATLLAGRDTIDIAFKAADEHELNSWSIIAFTTTGADTIQVYTLSSDGTTWVQVGLQDLSSGSNVTQIVASTTAKEFKILDPVPKKIRLMTPDASASCITITAGKHLTY